MARKTLPLRRRRRFLPEIIALETRKLLASDTSTILPTSLLGVSQPAAPEPLDPCASRVGHEGRDGRDDFKPIRRCAVVATARLRIIGAFRPPGHRGHGAGVALVVRIVACANFDPCKPIGYINLALDGIHGAVVGLEHIVAVLGPFLDPAFISGPIRHLIQNLGG